MPNFEETYEQVAAAEAEKVAALQSDDTLNFIFITDPHHQPGGNMLRTASMIREAAGRLKLDFIVCGGDISINGIKPEVIEAQQQITEALNVSGTPLLMVKGNHDDNSIYDYNQNSGRADHVVYPEEWRELALKPVQGIAQFDAAHPTRLYYYVDFPLKKTRVVVLDCTDHPYTLNDTGELNYLGQWHYVFSSGQLEWLAREALAMGSQPYWSVLIVSHVPILQEGVMGTDHAVRNDEALWGIIKAFREGGVSTSQGGEGEFTYQVAADFSEQGPRTVIGCLFGHVHVDQVLYKDNIPMISTLNACTHREFPECPEREEGTVSETAFDIMTADFKKAELKAHRIGAGAHRTVDFS
ncbi:hypothetical protein EBB07_06995 [Paenibacillaceae bacterium]|nr:hypothetical protein EBB07_06995 [Paenibacillaceae bacterium]